MIARILICLKKIGLLLQVCLVASVDFNLVTSNNEESQSKYLVSNKFIFDFMVDFLMIS